MKNKGFLISILLSVLLAGFALVLVSKYVESERKKAAASGPVEVVKVETERVYFTNTDIQMGQPVGKLQVKAAEMPKDLVPPGAITNLETLDGRVAAFNIPNGDILMESKVVTPSRLPRASMIIVPGQRLVSVQVNEVKASSFLIKNGDYVDIVGTMRVPAFLNPGGMAESIAVTFLQRVKVFDIVHGSGGETNLDADENERMARGVTATFLVNEREAEIILAAEELAPNLALVLRSNEDESVSEPPSELHAQIISLIEGKSTAPKRQEVAVEAPPAPAPQRRTVM